MSAYNYETLIAHLGHKLEVVTYGDGQNVSCECVDCNEVLMSFDKEEE